MGSKATYQGCATWRYKTLLGQFILFFLYACNAGSGEDLDISGRPIAEGGNLPLGPTLEAIQANVFDPFCITCHAGAAAPQGLRLDRDNSFSNLVGIPSSEASSILRVAPGDPDNSYLVQKIQGTASSGQQMPLGGPPLPQATIDVVRQWIADGALPPSGPLPGTAPVVVSLTPLPDTVSGTFPMQVLVSFDQDIDAGTVNTMSVIIERSGNDDLFDGVNDVVVIPTSVGLSPVNARLAEVDLSGVVPVEDLYRITVRGDGADSVRAIGGLALDGEFSGSLPSGDGTAGGDFVATFEVSGVQPTLQSIQDNVFTPVCSSCHSGPTGPSLPTGMDLSSASASLASLVEVTSIQNPPSVRVERGNADVSYLVQKLEGTASMGSRMPQGGPYLDDATMAAIRAWIDSGANP